MKTYIGIDNGTTGTIGIIDSDANVLHWCKTPTFRQANYTKKGSIVSRIDTNTLVQLFELYAVGRNAKAILEYPMIKSGPIWIHTTFSAGRSMEATLIVLECMKIPYEFITARVWQKALLPKVKRTQLKQASRDVAKRLYPNVHIPMECDGDGLLIAEFARRLKL